MSDGTRSMKGGATIRSIDTFNLYMIPQEKQTGRNSFLRQAFCPFVVLLNAPPG